MKSTQSTRNYRLIQKIEIFYSEQLERDILLLYITSFVIIDYINIAKYKNIYKIRIGFKSEKC